MAKKKYNNSNYDIADLEFLVKAYKETNPDVPEEVIRFHVYNNISSPEFSVEDAAMVNPRIYRLRRTKPLISKRLREEEIDKYPSIPYIKDKEVMLRKGRFNTGKISTNVLDSIYDSADRVGIPFEEALGLAGRESTLGIGRGFKEGLSISPTKLMSNWQLVQPIINNNSSIDRWDELTLKYFNRIPFTLEESDFYLRYIDNNYKEASMTRPITENPIDNALKYYMTGQYNPNDTTHTRKVREDGALLMTEPAIQKWLKTKLKKAYGGILNKFANWSNKVGDKWTGGNTFLGKMGVTSSNMGGIANTIGSTVTGLLNPNGNSTGVGNAMLTIGGLASNIPGLGIAGAAVETVGGVINTLFGSNINEEAVAQFRELNKLQMNYESGASTNEELLADFSSLTNLANVKKSEVGSDGWFSNKASNLTRDINEERLRANLAAITSLGNTAQTIDTTNDLLKGYNYSAYGGPINMRYTGTMSPFGNLFKDGGIYIKPSKRGTFTAAAKKHGKSVQAFASLVLANKENYSPAMVKKANFARNAAKWHAFGGELTHGGIFSNGTNVVGNGGTHELNPNEGVQIGVDELGIPNLVEENELIWNDYVFSNRLNVPKAVRLKYKLRGNKKMSFADAAKKLQKESEERPNDPISKNGLDAGLSRLAMEQELIRMKKQLRENIFAKGGKMGTLYLGEGPRSNFLQFKDYTYPNYFRDIPNFSQYTIRDPFSTPKPTYTTPDVSVSLPPSASSIEGRIADLFEPISRNIFTSTDATAGTDVGTRSTTEFKESPLRYAPIVGHAAGVISDIFSKPDYEAANEVRSIELNPSLVGFTPIGNKLRFTPYDIDYQINKLNASSGASRRNIMNTAGGNRAAAMAGLMGIDYNYTNALGDAYRQALEYNDKRREAVETFNRATDLYNSEMGLKAAMANAESRNAMTRARYERDKAAALLGQLARDAYNTRRSNNLNILLEDLGNLGKERTNRKWLDVLADKGVLKMSTKGEHVSKSGGKLNRKKKGGFTYA